MTIAMSLYLIFSFFFSKYRCSGFVLDWLPFPFAQRFYNDLGSRRAEGKLARMRDTFNRHFEVSDGPTSDTGSTRRITGEKDSFQLTNKS